jgi:hypothetical protein
LARGAVWYSTPGHGGLGVTLAWAAQNLTPAAQALGERWGGKLWYEEDCLYAVPFYECPSLDAALRTTGAMQISTREIMEQNAQVIRNYYPRYFDAEFKEICGRNPVVPPVQVGDFLTLTSATYGPISEIDDDGNYLIGTGWTGYSRIRKNHAMEYGTVVAREGQVIWRRANRIWKERQEA